MTGDRRSAAAALAFLLLPRLDGSPAGNGYQSVKVRLPRWPPSYSMRRSTLFMPCNYSGWHDVAEALQYGLVSYDWANAQALWSSAAPVDDEALLTAQADRLVAADRGGAVRVGVYRNAIKAFNWFGSIVQEKLDDPHYAGWFVQFRDCDGARSNSSYDPPACTLSKCSCAWHDHAGQLGGGTQDCGRSPCGGYVFDHRNASFSEWFVNEFIISNHTILRPGVSELYLDDRVELWGIAEAEGNFLRDTGLTPRDMQDLKSAFEGTMERVYDRIVELGSFAWQMLYDGPLVLPRYFENGTRDREGDVAPGDCAGELRRFCRPDSAAAGRALAYTRNPNPDNASVQGEQYLSLFLLTRGDYAWIGYDYRGCKAQWYPRPREWDVDYGESLGNCWETGADSRVFVRRWTKASVRWDCNAGTGRIDLAADPADPLVI